MKKHTLILFQILIVTIIVTITYWLTQEYIVFNSSFLEIKILSPLFYLLPVILSFLMSLWLVIKFDTIPKFILRLSITLVNIYLFLSVFMGTSKYCEDEKNMELVYLVFLWSIFLISVFMLIKYILPKLKFKDVLIIGVSTVLAFIDFYFFFITLDLLYYVGWFKLVNNI
ncbi:hypothetical protein IMCC3317_23410 [Kordia antarctica]|uniref:Uncharacterized protein n=1 Tax=Kordia antarctica TaxID=1218801 RepID=A0A7L4ZKB9_9FLAO|nr:hypothetical protein [Kordia antarctica]QHI36970.1 hypothetical protein IMCC3317_23410 [Kordia antarctica]